MQAQHPTASRSHFSAEADQIRWYNYVCISGSCEPRGRCRCVLILIMAIVMAFMAGWINAIGMWVGSVTVTHVTGIWTLVGIDISGPMNRDATIPFVEVLFAYFFGAYFAGAVMGDKKYKNIRYCYAFMLIFEALVLYGGTVFYYFDYQGPADPVSGGELDVIIGYIPKQPSFLAFAMFAFAAGMQNALITQYSIMVIGPPMRTSHTTGTWSDIPMLMGIATNSRLNGRGKSERDWQLLYFIPELLGFVFGAACAGAMLRAYAPGTKILSMLVPASCIFAIGFGTLIYVMLFSSNPEEVYTKVEKEENLPFVGQQRSDRPSSSVQLGEVRQSDHDDPNRFFG